MRGSRFVLAYVSAAALVATPVAASAQTPEALR